MKKLLSWLLCLTMILSSAGMTAMAEETWAPTASSYTADFTNADELSKWKHVLTSGTNETVKNGAVTWSGNGTGYLLPVASMKNFVFDAEFTHSGGDGYFGVAFGQDAEGTNITNNTFRFRAVNGRPLLVYSGMTIKNYEPKEGNGYQWNVNTYKFKPEHYSSDNYMTSKLKVIVYNNTLAAWVNDQLVYSYILDDTYQGGYIGIRTNYYRGILRGLSVREATADDLVFAESFDKVDSDTTDTTVGNMAMGIGSYKMTISGNNVGNGNAWWTKPGGSTMYIDKNKKVTGDHTYTAGFTFSSTSNNGTTRYIAPVFGIKDTETKETSSYYCVYIKWDGTIDVDKIKYDETQLKYVTESYKTSEGNYMTVSAADTKAKFPDKLGTKTTANDVLAPDVMWEYKHVLHDGTLDIYLDDVKMLSVKSKDFENLEGYAGIYDNGMASNIYYLGARAVDESADLNRPNQVKIRIADVNGLTENVGDKIVRFYTTQSLKDETTGETTTTETLYGTAYADANGFLDIALGHSQKYVAKLFENALGTTPISVKNITYTAGQQLVIDFPTDADFATLTDIKFDDGTATDVSKNAYPITLVGDAKTKESEAFGEALVLDGIGDFARVDNINAFALEDADKLTVEAVFIPRERKGIKTMTVVGGAPMVKAGTPAGYGLYVDQDAEGNDIIAFRIRVFDAASNQYLTKEASAPCEMDKAYYAAGVYDGSCLKLYVNAELKSTVSATGDIYVVKDVKNTYPLIGAEPYYLNNQVKHFFNGEIAKAKVANGAINAAAVLTTYENYILTDGYALEGEEFADDISAKVSFSTTVPAKGDTVTVTAAVRNTTDTEKTVTVKSVPGYFAALTSGEDTKELTVPAAGAATLTFTYKMLEGGREPFKVYVYENGEEVAYAENSLSVTGAGYYKGDIHNHSTRSDGVNTFEENIVEGFATKNLSYSYSTEHNQYNYYSVKKANDTNNLYNPEQFIVMPGSEFTTKVGHVNTYALDNDVSSSELSKLNKPFWDENGTAALESVTDAEGNPSAEKWQAFINLVEGMGEGQYGGLLYLNHTGDPKYFIEDSIIEQLSGFTGYEVWNGAASAFADMTLNQRNTWDKINSQGWGHVIGQASTDSHGSVMFGTIQRVSYMNGLSADEIDRTMEDGNSFNTNGAEIRFDINGAPMNGTAIVKDSKATFNINVYDPMGDIEEVKLVKNIVSGEFTTDNRTEEILFAKGENKVATWSYSEERDVAENEFYRVEVTTAKNPYGSMDSKGNTMTDAGAGKGWAFTNNIWISTEGESNSTNISEISYNGSNITVSELPTGIRYLSGSGNMVLNNLTIVADGEASTAIEDDILTISVTAEDGTVKTTELSMIGDITVIEALTTIEFGEVECEETAAEAVVMVNDEEGLLDEEGAILVFAVYNDGKLIGLDTEVVSSELTEVYPYVEYTEQSDISTIVMKAMLFRTLEDLTPLCDEVVK